MGKGGYLGGSTILRPGSNWFSKTRQKSKLDEVEREIKKRQQEERVAQANAKKTKDEKRRVAAAARMKNDPKHLARMEKKRIQEKKKMDKVEVIVKRSDPKRRSRIVGKN